MTSPKSKVDRRRTSSCRVLAATIISVPLLTLSSFANASEPLEDNVAVEDAVTQFNELRSDGEWLAVHAHSYQETTGQLSSSHYQGIVRGPYKPDGDNNYLYITKSGELNTNYIGTAQISSTSNNPHDSALHGEHLGTNLIEKDAKPQNTTPPVNDKIVSAMTFANWKHPGGPQAVGDVLAVPFEQALVDLTYPHPITGVPVETNSRIYFFDTRTPSTPVQMPYYLDMIEAEVALSVNDYARVRALTGKERIEAGVAAITKLPNGKFLLLVTYGLDAVVVAFVSNDDSFFTQESDGSWQYNDNFEFEFYDVWFAEDQYVKAVPIIPAPIPPNANYDDWPWLDEESSNSVSSIQQLSLINQTDGKIFLAGSYNRSKLAPVLNREDYLMLYELAGYPDDPNDASGQIKINFHAAKHIHMDSGDGDKFGNANAGLGAYVSPTRELIFYGIAHNESDDRVRMSEYRHRDMAYSGNIWGPKFRPNHLGDPVTLNIGDTFTVDADSRFIGSWADFYEDANYNKNEDSDDDTDSNGSKRILGLEPFNQSIEDFEDFGDLDNFHDKMSSYRGALGPHHILAMYQDDSFENLMRYAIGAANPSGDGYSNLTRTAYVGSNDNDILSSAEFVNIRAIYNGHLQTNPHELALIFTQLDLALLYNIGLSTDEINDRIQLIQWEWDLDGDGSYETSTGSPEVTFPASEAGTTYVAVRYNGVEQDVDGNRLELKITVLKDAEPDVEVPDLVGMTLDDATIALENISLLAGAVEYAYDASIVLDLVVSHTPAKETLVPVDTSVDLVLSLGLEGDIDLDGDVDRDDINLVTEVRNTPADLEFDRRDLDGDGMITALDMRKIIQLCTRSRCATE